MARCQAANPAGSNCPETLGPDYDFGGSSAILQTINGKDILLAAGKGGVAIALDPDNRGGAADGSRVYYPLQQAGGGLKALNVKTGKVDWNAAINADNRGQAGPASAIPGVVFTGGWDGILRAVDAGGKVIWSVNAVRDFETVNGVQAKGGAMGSAGATVAGGMVLVGSGYAIFSGAQAGNVLLAFSAE